MARRPPARRRTRRLGLLGAMFLGEPDVEETVAQQRRVLVAEQAREYAQENPGDAFALEAAAKAELAVVEQNPVATAAERAAALAVYEKRKAMLTRGAAVEPAAARERRDRAAEQLVEFMAKKAVTRVDPVEPSGPRIEGKTGRRIVVRPATVVAAAAPDFGTGEKAKAEASIEARADDGKSAAPPKPAKREEAKAERAREKAEKDRASASSDAIFLEWRRAVGRGDMVTASDAARALDVAIENKKEPGWTAKQRRGFLKWSRPHRCMDGLLGGLFRRTKVGHG